MLRKKLLGIILLLGSLFWQLPCPAAIPFSLFQQRTDTVKLPLSDTISKTIADTLIVSHPDSLVVATTDTLIPQQIHHARSVNKLTTTPILIDSSIVTYFTKSFDSLYLGSNHTVDTSQFYATYFDPLDDMFHIHATLSNTGLANRNLTFRLPISNGIDMAIPANQRYVRNTENIRYLMPVQPFSELRYTMGSKKEQQLKVAFSRQIAPGLLLGIDYALLNSPGPYLNSKTNDNAAAFSARYQTPNNRYGVLAHYIFNKLEQQENGGIVDDSVFMQNLETDRRVIDVNLQDASNTIKSTGFGFEHYFNLSRPPAVATNDSIPAKKNFQTGRITHSLSFLRNQFSYVEDSPLASFYQAYDTVLDSTATLDSTYVMSLRNKIQWSSLAYKMHKNDVPFYVYFGVTHGYYEQFSALINDSVIPTKTTYNQLEPYGGIVINLFKATRINARASVVASGYQSGDLTFDGQWKQFLGNQSKNIGSLFFNLGIYTQSPNWFQKSYQSNHFRWENNFDKSNIVALEAGYQFRGLTAGVSQSTIDKFIYMNQSAKPQQTSGTLNVRSLYGNFQLTPGKFTIAGSVRMQQSDNDSVLHIPALMARMKFSFSQPLFNNAAVINPGFSIYYFTEYYADAYMPALRTFYLQNDKKVGNYPFLDIYLGLKVKRANIYLQYANLLGLTGDFRYFTTPHYPMRDARFYFGVNWRFYQ